MRLRSTERLLCCRDGQQEDDGSILSNEVEHFRVCYLILNSKPNTYIWYLLGTIGSAIQDCTLGQEVIFLLYITYKKAVSIPSSETYFYTAAHLSVHQCFIKQSPFNQTNLKCFLLFKLA